MRLAAAGLCMALGPLAAHAESLDAYKADVARHIHRASRGETFDGAAPPLLKSVVVLSVTIEASGRARARVVRSNGFRSLDAKALRSVRRASPLPRWSAAGGRPVHYYETWLFRKDGRFQIRSIAPPQASA
ncbi:MAG TPA: energy transducer TonB [Burkholderiales bacterium]|nr:energy transducer TonB [Burkholderiales bacterium]